MPELILRILRSRGITDELDIQELFYPKLRQIAHPFTIHEMDKAVARLLVAFSKQEKILIYGDYDLDGTPAVALLLDGFKRLGFAKLCYYQPKRSEDGYGFHLHRAQEFVQQGVSLVVTVDVGITDVETVTSLQREGVDVILTDHHLPKEMLPPAYAILNPNKGFCTSRLQHLCGTGVAFYLLLALKLEFTRQKILAVDFDAKELLDLFALATVTDMVPLTKENRVLVRHGLVQLADSQRPAIRRLLGELGLSGRSLTSQDVAFKIAPKLNALTRLDTSLRALDVFLADEEQAKTVVADVLRVNEERVQLQAKAKEVAARLIDQNDTSKFIFMVSHEFHQGVVSLLANDLMGEYSVPVFIGAKVSPDQIIGSARAPSESYNLQDVLGYATSHLKRWGGHQLAAGFELENEQTEFFRTSLHDFFANDPFEKTLVTTSSENFDAEAELSDLNMTFMKWYENMGPFGVQFERPKILLKNVRVVQARKLKGKFYKYQLAQKGSQIDALWFRSPKEIPEGSQIDAVVEPQINEYNGRQSVQVVIDRVISPKL